MKTFKDNKGRDWPARIDVRALQRVRDGMSYNLADRTVITQTLQKLFNDDLFVVEVAWWIVQPDALKRGVGDDDFFAAMQADVIAPAALVIREELISFFRDPAVRRVIAGLADRTQTAMQALLEGADQELENQTSPPTSSSTAGDSPASSASTPAPAPSASSS